MNRRYPHRPFVNPRPDQLALLPEILLLEHAMAARGEPLAVLLVVVGIGPEPRHDLVGVRGFKVIAMRDELLEVGHSQRRRVRKRVQSRARAVEDIEHWSSPERKAPPALASDAAYEVSWTLSARHIPCARPPGIVFEPLAVPRWPYRDF
jgi:hypothetical protein